MSNLHPTMQAALAPFMPPADRDENAKLREALRWAMARIEAQCPHCASEGDAELYRFAEAKALIR